jgi:hypothetical protein
MLTISLAGDKRNCCIGTLVHEWHLGRDAPCRSRSPEISDEDLMSVKRTWRRWCDAAAFGAVPTRCLASDKEQSGVRRRRAALPRPALPFLATLAFFMWVGSSHALTFLCAPSQSITAPSFPTAGPYSADAGGIVTGVNPNDAGAILAAGCVPLGMNNAVGNTTRLRLTRTSAFANGVWRLTDGVAGAPPLFFVPSSGVCATDDGASCVNSGDGNSWVPSSTELDAREFGVVFNNATDNSVSLQAAFNWAASGQSLKFPCGTARFNSFLTIPQGNYYKIIGQGACSLLLYSGTNTSGDIIQVGGPVGGSGESDNVTMNGFRLDTTTQMTSGAALHLWHINTSQIDPIVGGHFGNGKFYNAVWLDEGGFNVWPYVEISGASAANVLVNGARAHSYINSATINGNTLTGTITSGTSQVGDYVWGSGVTGVTILSQAIVGSSLTATLSGSPSSISGAPVYTSAESWFPNYVSEWRFGKGYIFQAPPQSCPNIGSCSWPLYGIEVAGGVGGFSVDTVDIIGNQHNLGIDNSITGTANQTVILGSGAYADIAASDDIYLNDNQPPTWAGGSKWFVHKGWQACAGCLGTQNIAANGVNVLNWANGHVVLDGYTIEANGKNGVYDQDASATVQIGSTETFVANKNYDLASSLSSPLLSVASGTYFSTIDTDSLTSAYDLYSPLITLTGTALPYLESSGSASGFTYSEREAYYQLQGRYVKFTFSLGFTASGTASGGLTLQNLPLGQRGGGAGGGPAVYATGWTGLTSPITLSVDSNGGNFAALYQWGGTGIGAIQNSALGGGTINLWATLTWLR